METRYSQHQLETVLASASRVTETDMEWAATFDNDCTVQYDRFVSEKFKAGETVVISKSPKKSYMGRYYEASASESPKR